MRNASVQFVLENWNYILKMPANKIGELGISIPIPFFEENVIGDVCEEAKKAFQRSDNVLDLKGAFYVVGDIHGNIFDLIRILQVSEPPPLHKFLFLGDYVDRGEYSIEVITLLFALKAMYPDDVYLLRGNHEFDNLNFTYGFYQEVIERYGNDYIYNMANNAFGFMPLVAIVNDSIFAVHGGLSPKLDSLEQLNKIRRPIERDPIVTDLTWSDPSSLTVEIDKNTRGSGLYFGVKPLKDFLAKFNCKYMIRAHQCVQKGVSTFGKGLLYTVFSCSNYCESNGNRAGLIFIYENSNENQIFSLPEINQVPRNIANIKSMTKEYKGVVTTEQNSLTFRIKIGEKPARSKSGYNFPCKTTKVVAPLPVSGEKIEYSFVKPKLFAPLRRSSLSVVPKIPLHQNNL